MKKVIKLEDYRKQEKKTIVWKPDIPEEQMARIRASLEKINALIAELKKMGQEK